MTDSPTPPFGTPGGRPGADATQAYPTQPPTGYPAQPPSGYPAYPPPPPGAGYGPAPAPTGGKGPVIGVIVALVVLALVIAGVGIAFLARGDDDDVADRSSPTTEAGTTEAPDGSTQPDTTDVTDDPTTTDATTDDAVDRVVGEWSGTYTCVQGLTVLDLTIEAGVGADAVTAVFAFSPDPSNPDVPDGSFAMSGTATDAGGLVLEPGAWIDRPGTFQSVGLAAPLPATPDRLVGTIEDPGCTAFDLTRTR